MEQRTMLTTKEATDLQNLLQLMVYYIDLFDLGDLGANTSEKRKALAMAAIRQLSAKIVSLTPPAILPFPGEEELDRRMNG